jgi:RNA polymerase sigma-54 factor
LEHKQRLLITPQMQQAMFILQLNNHELADYISNLALENPVMDVETPKDSGDAGESDPFWEKLRRLDDTNGYSREENSYDGAENGTRRFEPADSQGETLAECIHLQLLAFDLSETGQKTALRIIENLDENGYLTEHLESIADSLHVSLIVAQTALDAIQHCEPFGVGARDLKECLMLQLQALDLFDHPAYRMVQTYFDSLAHNKMAYIAEQMGISVDEVAGARRLIQTLDPKPAKNFSKQNPQYIFPDVCVENIEGQYVPFINDDRVPLIRINAYYRRLAKATDDEQVKKYLFGKFRQANWVVKCIEQRNSTILRSTARLIELQRDFFDSGPDSLASMTLADISESINVHVSTISRTFKGKYLQCSWGLFPFGFFFSPGIGKTESSTVSSQMVKAKIRNLIENEDRKRPKSDEDIGQFLKRNGIDISRRTVAKYRDELGILSSRLRKEF